MSPGIVLAVICIEKSWLTPIVHVAYSERARSIIEGGASGESEKTGQPRNADAMKNRRCGAGVPLEVYARLEH